MITDGFGFQGSSGGGGGGSNAVILLGVGSGSSYRCGNSNLSKSVCSTISGGNNNIIDIFSTCSGYYVYGNTIGGGSFNVISSNSAYYGNSGGVTIGGGACNTSGSGYYGFNTISGGYCNVTLSGNYTNYTTIGGGYINVVGGANSTVGGGYSNTAFCSSVVSGGAINSSTGFLSSILGGANNTSSNDFTVVGGGSQNVANNQYGVVGGGLCNLATGYASAVLGGRENGSCSSYSFVGSGYCNNACGFGSVIAGGLFNTINSGSNYSAVLGGKSNTVSGLYSGAFGCNLSATSNCTFYTNNHCACGSLFTSAINSGCAVCATTNGELIGYTPIVPPPATNFGLFAQTGNSTPITNTTTEGTLIDGGVGTLSVPAGGFSIGDSFRAEFGGYISAQNNNKIRIRVKSGSVVLADSGLLTMPQINNQVWLLAINFTIRSLGVAGVASIVTLGEMHILKLASGTQEGFGFNTINNTTFDTTIPNTLDITVEWDTASINNSIYSDMFVLNKIY